MRKEEPLIYRLIREEDSLSLVFRVPEDTPIQKYLKGKIAHKKFAGHWTVFQPGEPTMQVIVNESGRIRFPH